MPYIHVFLTFLTTKGRIASGKGKLEGSKRGSLASFSSGKRVTMTSKRFVSAPFLLMPGAVLNPLTHHTPACDRFRPIYVTLPDSQPKKLSTQHGM